MELSRGLPPPGPPSGRIEPPSQARGEGLPVWRTGTRPCQCWTYVDARPQLWRMEPGGRRRPCLFAGSPCVSRPLASRHTSSLSGSAASWGMEGEKHTLNPNARLYEPLRRNHARETGLGLGQGIGLGDRESHPRPTDPHPNLPSAWKQNEAPGERCWG